MNQVKKASVVLLLTIPLVYLSGCVVTPPASRVAVSGTVVNGDLDSFYFAVGEYYRVPRHDVIYLHERRIPDYEIPVVLFISQRVRVAPEVIVNLRLSGMSWMDISLRFGVGPEVYYVPVQNVYGPPYGHAYGHYQNRNRNEWHNIRLADDDVVNLVNLRFISERYNSPPEDVMRLRSSGRNFVNINNDIRSKKTGGEYQQQERKEVREPVMQQGGQGRDMRQEERRDVQAPVRKQVEQKKTERQQERQETRESVKQPSKKKAPAEQKNKKGKGVGREEEK